MNYKRQCKHFLIKLYRIYWNLKTHSTYLLLGAEGLIQCVQVMPKPFIIFTLQKYGAQVGKNTKVDRGLILHNAKGEKPFANLIVGEGVYIGRNVLLDITQKVIIEDNSALGASCQIWTHVGDYTLKLYNGDYQEKRGLVIIKQSTICYSGTIIGQGTCIGPYSRIGAGSVVITDIPEKEFWAGLPARFIKKRDIK